MGSSGHPSFTEAVLMCFPHLAKETERVATSLSELNSTTCLAEEGINLLNQKNNDQISWPSFSFLVCRYFSLNGLEAILIGTVSTISRP